MESAQGQAISKDELPDCMFMCSELYIAAFEGRTEEVLIGLQTGGVHTATAARNGRRRPSPGDATPTGMYTYTFATRPLVDSPADDDPNNIL